MIAATSGERTFRAVNTALLMLVGLLTFYPFLYMFVVSLNEGIDTARGGLFLWPRAFTLFNYQVVLASQHMQRAYLVTIGRMVLGTSLALLVNGLAAYALTFPGMPGRRLLLMYIVIPLVFSGGLIPYYLQLYRLRLVNTFWVYVIPHLFAVWNMFIMRAYFLRIPDSLREASEMDGASQFTIFFRIIVPLGKPTLAAVGLFTAVWHWNDWFSGAFYVSNVRLIPVQTFLQRLLTATNQSIVTGQNAVAEGGFRSAQMFRVTFVAIRMATVMAGTLPVLIVYPFIQKYFVSGVLLGSIRE